MSWPRKINGNWYLYYRENGKEQKPIPCGKSYQNLLTEQDKLERRLRVGDKDNNLTVQDLYDEYLKHSEKVKAPATVNHIKDHIPAFLKSYGEAKLTDLTKGHIEQYKANLLQKYSVNGVIIKLVALKAMLEYATEREWIYRNPAKLVKKPTPIKVGRALTPEEFKVLLKEGKPDKDFMEIIAFSIYSKLREGELIRLRKEHIHDYLAHVQKVRKGKKSEKVIPIPRVIRYMVDRVKSGPIFPGWTVDKINDRQEKMVKAAKESGKFTGRFRFYDFRHTAATWAMTRSKIKIEYVSGLLGHSSIKVTKDTYGHFQDQDLMRQVENENYGFKLP